MPLRSIGRALQTILNVLLTIQQQGTLILMKIDDLNAAVAGIQTEFAAYDAAVSAEIATLKAAHEDDDTAAVEASVATINALRAAMKAKVDALTPAASAPTDSVPGATASDTVQGGADSVSGAAAADTIQGGAVTG